MKTLLKFVVVLCALLSLKESTGSTIPAAANHPSVILQGEIIDKALVDSPDFESEIYIQTSKYAFEGTDQGRTTHSWVRLKYKAGEEFKAILSAPADIFYLYIYYTTPGMRNEILGGADRIFIVQAGDSLHCQIDKDNIIFSGEGAERMNCQTQIFKKAYIPSESEHILFREKKFKEYLTYVEKRANASLDLQLNIIEKYRDRLDKDVVQILTANCYGMKYYSRIKLYNIFFGNRSLYEDFLAVLNEQYNLGELDEPPTDITGSNLAKAPVYTNYLLELEELRLYMTSENSINRMSEKYTNKLFSRLQDNYDGIIKNKMLALFFLNYTQSNFVANYLDEILNEIDNVHYSEILLNRKAKFSPRTPFFEFELENAQGDTVRLSDFKNKVVFIHFWYTGCGGCIHLAKAILPVLEKFKDNSNIEFITVSTDRDQETWLQALKGGKYTHDVEINLYAGKAHPLIKYYNMHIFPAFYLLQDGRIFSATPPRPELDRETGQPRTDGKTAELITLIELALSRLEAE